MPNLGTKPPMVEEEGELLLTFIHWGEKAHFYTLVGRKNLDKAFRRS